MEYLREQVHEDADVIMGQVELPDHEESIRVTVIATGFRREHDGALIGARPAAASQATVQPATQRYSVLPSSATGEYPAARSRGSSCPPPRRSAATAAAEAARASQMSLMPQAGADIGGLLDIPTYLRKQSE